MLQMGIGVKMITGDQLLIGKETAKQLGMGTNMFTTEALLKVRCMRVCGGVCEGGCGVCLCGGSRWRGSGFHRGGWCCLSGLLAGMSFTGAAACCPPPPPAPQAKQGIGLVEGHSSVEDLVEEADGFAEVFPEHKFMSVQILQVRRGRCVWCEGSVAGRQGLWGSCSAAAGLLHRSPAFPNMLPPPIRRRSASTWWA